MRNLFTCDNCIFNPAQYQEIGARVGYCLKHSSILRNSSHTTCHFFRRKDLPLFLSIESQKEHAKEFRVEEGIVFYYSRYEEQKRNYSEKHVWETNTFDPYLHEVAIYHRSRKKWTYLQAFLGSRNPIKHAVASSLIRRYIQQCGPQQDNYRLILSSINDLGERLELRPEDFRVDLEIDEFNDLKESYLKDIVLLRLYGVQEYGEITENENVMWISDELNGALLSSWAEFFVGIRRLVPLIQSYVISAAQTRGTFFPETGPAGDGPDND